MMPIGELRLGIPYGMAKLGVPAFHAFFWGILGNTIPVFFLLKLLPSFFTWIFHHSTFLEHHFKKYFEKLHSRHSLKFNELGAIFLAIFVAIPLPGTGAWTGALIAYILNIPFWLAFGSISLGILGAGVLITFFAQSFIWIF